MTQEEESKRSIVEPLFDRLAPVGLVTPPEEIEEQVKSDLAAPATPIGHCYYPPSTHTRELGDELRVHFDRGDDILSSLFYCTFVSVDVRTQLISPTPWGAWPVGEDAEYEVELHNITGFDLQEMRVHLHVVNHDGKASIKSPPGPAILLGEIKHYYRQIATFELHGEQFGAVTLALWISGYIGCYRQRFIFTGQYCDDGRWRHKPFYRQSFVIGAL